MYNNSKYIIDFCGSIVNRSGKGKITMPEKISIADLKYETYPDKPLKKYSEMMADPSTAFGIGSAAAEAAASAAALSLRAVGMTGGEDPAIVTAAKDLETLRTYFLHLMDEENKAKRPLEKRLASGAPDEEIEGGYRTACAIIDEVLYAAIKVVDVLDVIADKLCPDSVAIASSALFFARAAMDTVRVQLAMYSTKMNEPIYARTVRREPEIAMEGILPTVEKLLAKFADAMK